ncbi:MAG TPA: cardiolipin synthase ClsB [Burkholderiales bacterium]|jgi:cardiolipin synthase|nr:cardiolipin synthase ClsB [Burkholderiales bacterium]
MIVRPGNRIRLLESGAEYFPELERAIDSAEREIYLETYIYEADETGYRIADALIRAARRGVDVHVLIDGFGSREFPDDLRSKMDMAGVQLLVYRPGQFLWRLQRHRLRRMHRKLAVIDARVGFCGGINIIDDRNTPGHTPPRFDYAVRVEGPLIADMHRAARQLWMRTAWLQLKAARRRLRSRPRPDLRKVGAQSAAFLVRDNFRHRHDIEEAYLDAIANARSEVVIACAYFLPGMRFRRALCEAVARGVRIVLLLQGKVEYVMLHYASRALYRQLLDAGVEIHEYMRSFLHAKVAVADEAWATVGSSNLDPISFLLAREANVVVLDEGFAGELRASLAHAIETGARPVRRAVWKPPLHERALTWLAYGAVRLAMGVFGYATREDAP